MKLRKRIDRQLVQDYIFITLGVAVSAAALQLFLVPNRIAAGGVSGIGTILYHVFGIPMGVTMLALNLPMFLAAYRLVGRTFFVRSAYATLLFSLLLDVLVLPNIAEDLFLACIYGGGLLGAGLGLVFLGGGSTGGTDIVAKIVNHYHPRRGIGRMMLAMDILIVAGAGFIFSWPLALYALAALALSSWVIDFLLQGRTNSRAFLIVTRREGAIAQAIFEQLERGVTRLEATGMYTKQKRGMLLCVVETRSEYNQLRRIVREIDDRAFVIVSNVNEVLGLGFFPNDSKQ